MRVTYNAPELLSSDSFSKTSHQERFANKRLSFFFPVWQKFSINLPEGDLDKESHVLALLFTVNRSSGRIKLSTDLIKPL